ncbi:hypothetical protein SCHPADRAFT_1002689 [Schizopora paradoxa]|uniref:Protein kinase domain-containing protein n=1 Tax=Schizopora paradoxa TaxID=27342 RepID=A0A0H2R8F9_9AGAM|nr:hypothetical protein SCHPADRAFT_1002689 [Schizopora paradoxa]
MDDMSTKDELIRINDVLGNVSHYNLEKLICTPLTHATSTGGSSDTYTSTFKEKILQDALVSSKSSSCPACRGLKESRSSEMTCWRYRDQWKTIARDLYALSKLSHPNLLPFVGYLLVDGFPALVTPWVNGGNLRDRIKNGALSRSEEMTVSIARGIADGLNYLHSKLNTIRSCVKE